MVMRWVASAYLATEKNFRKVQGYQDLWALAAALRLLFGLLASGQIRLRRIKGFRDLEEKHETAA